MVSELLGSWGDNESSPECLNIAQKYLKDNGISIPKSYQSYVAPISSSKLFISAMHGQGLDIPYVCNLYSYIRLCDPLPLFKFDHPNNNYNNHSNYYNNRASTIIFNKENYIYKNCDVVVHGFAGYFEAVLYDSNNDDDRVVFSSNPTNQSYDENDGLQYSFFPIYLPIRYFFII